MLSYMKTASKNGHYWQRQSDTKLSRNTVYEDSAIVNWPLLWTRLSQGVRRLWVALSFRAYQHGWRIPGINLSVQRYAFRIALGAIVLFILARKELQFSVRMLDREVPTTQLSANQTAPVQADQMSLAQPISWSSKQTPQTDDLDRLDPVAVDRFILRFERVAQTEQRKFGIPASVNMAMAILASQAGTSPVAETSANFFGPVMEHESYGNAWENWRAHSRLIARDYHQLITLRDHPQQWLQQLIASGYTQDSLFEQKVQTIIDRYDLDRLRELTF